MNILLTGGAGFVGSHIAEFFISYGHKVFVIDNLTYAGRLDRLKHLNPKLLSFHFHDIAEPLPASLLSELRQVDCIIHTAAESHVVRSIDDPVPFVRSNILGTLNILEAARKLSINRFVYTSTDEVFGVATENVKFTEDDALNPTNPYAATKAAGEMLVKAWHRTFGVPTIITRTMNIFGERQHPEKFIPSILRRLLKGQPLTIHTERGIPCTRHWLYVWNQASAIRFLLSNGKVGETYNISGEERNVLEIASSIAKLAGTNMKYGELEVALARRGGGDFNYAVDDSKIRKLGWFPGLDFEAGLRQTIEWTLENKDWLE